jgi:uncharacterized protein (TIGR02145 family)/prepilin-type N-terminal cleavage/methylation domain-containing protein
MKIIFFWAHFFIFMRHISLQLGARSFAWLKSCVVICDLTGLPFIVPRGVKRGFTLIELLVVIAIISVIASLTIVGFNGIRISSRDIKRTGDIHQLQVVLEMYKNDNGIYPSAITVGNTLAGPDGVIYMNKVPATPNHPDGSCADDSYTYTQDASGASYHIAYCLGKSVQGVAAGNTIAVPGNIGMAGSGDGGGGGLSCSGGTPYLSPDGTTCLAVDECATGTCGDCSSLVCGAVNFAANGSCVSGTGQTFQAVKIGTQCWLDKAIDLGTRINGSINMTNNASSSIQKWCYMDTPVRCTADGALYNWHMAMYLPNACDSSSTGNCLPSAYVSGSGATAKRQGICPKGWHIPSDYELWLSEKYIQENATTAGATFASDDTGSGGDYYADQIGANGTTLTWRGATDATGVGAKMKTPGSSGLNVILAGWHEHDESDPENITDFAGAVTYVAAIWSSSQVSDTVSWSRIFSYSQNTTWRQKDTKASYGFTVRCVKD